MSLMLTATVRLSICPCGFPSLREGIEVGALYWIDDERIIDALWKCGGCKTLIALPAIFAISDDGKRGYLPVGLFDLPTKKPC